MAVGASTTESRPPVLDVHLLVAFVARQNRFFDQLVGVVARFASHRRMGRKPRKALGLERPMAARAVPASKDIGLRLEDMARVTVHRHAIEIHMRKRSLFVVALRADPDIGSLEGGFARLVAFVALHVLVDHVCQMSR